MWNQTFVCVHVLVNEKRERKIICRREKEKEKERGKTRQKKGE